MRMLLGVAAAVLFLCLPAVAQEDDDIAPGLAGLSDEQRSKYEGAQEAYSVGDYARANQAFKVLATQGVGAASWLLGVMDFQGLGTKKDEAAARTHFLEAAKTGGAYYQEGLAELYFDGTPPFAKDCDESEKLYRQAAAQGSASAKNRLTKMSVCRGK